MTGDQPQGPPLSDDGRFWWDGERWQPMQEPAPQSTSSLTVFVGVLVALIVAGLIGWVIFSAATANDDFECSRERAERQLEGLPPPSC